jgi:hypothetical protein
MSGTAIGEPRAEGNIDRMLGVLCTEVRALAQRIDELRDDFRMRAADTDELDQRLRAVELRQARADAASATAETHRGWRRMAGASVLGSIAGVAASLATRWIAH